MGHGRGRGVLGSAMDVGECLTGKQTRDVSTVLGMDTRCDGHRKPNLRIELRIKLRIRLAVCGVRRHAMECEGANRVGFCSVTKLYGRSF